MICYQSAVLQWQTDRKSYMKS